MLWKIFVHVMVFSVTAYAVEINFFNAHFPEIWMWRGWEMMSVRFGEYTQVSVANAGSIVDLV